MTDDAALVAASPLGVPLVQFVDMGGAFLLTIWLCLFSLASQIIKCGTIKAELTTEGYEDYIRNRENTYLDGILHDDSR